MDLKIVMSGNILVARLLGNISGQTLEEFFAPIFERMNDKPVNLIVNMKKVTYISSSAVGMITKIFNLCTRKGGNFRLIESEAGIVNRVLHVSGIDKMVIIAKSEVAASNDLEAIARSEHKLEQAASAPATSLDDNLPVAQPVDMPSPDDDDDADDKEGEGPYDEAHALSLDALRTVRKILEGQTPQEAARRLLAGLDSDDWRVRMHFLRGLKKMDGPAYAHAIMPLLHDAHPLVRLEAVEAAFCMGQGVGAPILRKSLLGDDAAVRRKAIAVSERLSGSRFEVDADEPIQERDLQSSGLSLWLAKMEGHAGAAS